MSRLRHPAPLLAMGHRKRRPDRRRNESVIALTAGTVVYLAREASVQFGGDRALRLRIASIDTRPIRAGCG
ncbi:hypothetical protein ABZ671_29805 [Micromonospora sp. NPDC006766]|uniref:hypothetical protein n=1 Tax=Micromonospora sp. NPDC006766 TaxID=3154778 RepID=UPI0033D28E4C